MISTYENYLLSENTIGYVGPKSLFDPNFVPSRIVPRKKQGKLLTGFIMDAINDEYGANINIYGLKGCGKNLQVNHFFEWLHLYQESLLDGEKLELREYENDFLLNNKDSLQEISRDRSSYKDLPFMTVTVNCEKKEISQIFFEIVQEISEIMDLKMNIQDLLESHPSKLWQILQFILSRLKIPLILYMQQAEYVKKEYLNKIFSLAKSHKNLKVITAMNTGSRVYSFRGLDNLDQKIFFDSFKISELDTVTKERCTMAFKKEVPKDIKNLVVDYVSQFSQKVPGQCVNILKDICHPLMAKEGEISVDKMRTGTQYYFDNIAIDVFSLTDFINSSTFEDQLFLEYLLGYFQNRNVTYIPFDEMKNAYKMTVEELGCKLQWTDFYSSLGKFVDSNIILPNQSRISNGAEKVDGVYLVPHFLPMPVEEIDELLKYAFGMLEEKDFF